MIWEICRKELLANFQSFRFYILLVISIFLFVMSLFLTSAKYTEALREYERNMERFRQSKKTMSIEAYRRPNPLSFAIAEGDDDAIKAFSISLHQGISLIGGDEYGVNSTFPEFQPIDWAFIFKIVFSLFAILLTFDAISGEKERGTLKLMCSNSLSRASIIIAKYFGALITVMIPAVMGVLIAVTTANFMDGIVLVKESILRLVLVTVAACIYISIFVLLGIAVSCIVSRSSLSLLILLSIWVIFITVVPNVAGIIAESISDAPSEYELSRKSDEIWGEGGTIFIERVKARDLREMDELREEWGRVLTEQTEKKMMLMDSYINTIYAKEDTALSISRLSPATVFELICAEIVDNGVMSQRRFDKAVRRYYDLYEDYVRQKTGEVRKYMYVGVSLEIDGKWIAVEHPPVKPLPEDTSDFPAFPEANLSISESIVSVLWYIGILLVWNAALFLLSHFYFIRRDVR